MSKKSLKSPKKPRSSTVVAPQHVTRWGCEWTELWEEKIPSRELTYPTWGKGKSSSNMPYQGDVLISWRVFYSFNQMSRVLFCGKEMPAFCIWIGQVLTLCLNSSLWTCDGHTIFKKSQELGFLAFRAAERWCWDHCTGNSTIPVPESITDVEYGCMTACRIAKETI